MKTKKYHKKLTKKQRQKRVNKKHTKKQIIKRNKKYNKTKKYIGSGPFDNMVKTATSKIAPKIMNSRALGVVPGTMKSQQMYNGRPMPDMTQLADNQSRMQKEKLKTDMKKTFNKFMNKYDEYTVPAEQHIPMNEYGRYPAFFKKIPENMKKPGDIEPYENIHEEAWKKYKSAKGKEEFIRQYSPDVTQFMNEERGKENKEEKSEDDKDDLDDFNFGLKTPPGYIEEKAQKKLALDEITKSPLMPSKKLPLSYQIFLSAAKELKIQKYYDVQLENTIENNITDSNLKEKVIAYNNETKDADDVGFIGWSQAALLTNFNLSSPLLNTIIEKTAQGVAIAKSMVVAAYDTTSNVTETTFSVTHRIIPSGIKTAYGLMDWGLVKSVSALINMGSTKDIDWKDPKVLEKFNNSLFITLDIVLGVLLKDIIKKGCGEAIPEILGHVINKDTIKQVDLSLQLERKDNKNLDELFNTTNEYCNKIVPAISDSIKANGISLGIGNDANQLLSEFNDKAFPLFKNILWNILKDTWNNSSFELTYSDGENLDLKIETPYSKENELELKKSFEEIFKKTSLQSVIKVIVEEINNAYDSYENVDKEKVNETVQNYVTNPPNQEITNQENEVKVNLDNTLKQQVAIGDLATNLVPSIAKLLLLWNKEILDQGYSEYNSAACLLNVVDLRINTLLKETCEIHAKKLVGNIIPASACNEKFYKIAALLYDESIDKSKVSDEDIDYAKSVIKRIIINIMLDLSEKQLLPYLKDKIWTSFTEGYIFLDDILDTNITS